MLEFVCGESTTSDRARVKDSPPDHEKVIQTCYITYKNPILVGIGQNTCFRLPFQGQRRGQLLNKRFAFVKD